VIASAFVLLTTVLPTAIGLPATVLARVSGAAGPVMIVGGGAGGVVVVPDVVPVVPDVVPLEQAGSVDVAVHVVPVVVPVPVVPVVVPAVVPVVVPVVPVVVPPNAAPFVQPESVEPGGHVIAGVVPVVPVVPAVVPVVVPVVPVAPVPFDEVVAGAAVDVSGAGGGGVVVSTAGLAVDVASSGVVSVGVMSTAGGALVSTAVDAFASTPVPGTADASAPSGAGAGAGGVVLTGGGVSRNDTGSMPTLPETIGKPDAAVDVPSPNAVGSTPTELVTTGGGVAVDFAGDVDDAGNGAAGGVKSRLSLTTGTRTFRVSGVADAVAADCVACERDVPAGCLKTRGDGDACDFAALAGAAPGTRNNGKRRETTVRACRECTRGGGATRAAITNGAT
jgi:signal-induced proliferation-associated 1 like protein 3